MVTATQTRISAVLCVSGASCRSPERSPGWRWSTSAPDESSQASNGGWWRPVCPHTQRTLHSSVTSSALTTTPPRSSPRPVSSHHLHLRHLIAPFCSFLHIFNQVLVWGFFVFCFFPAGKYRINKAHLNSLGVFLCLEHNLLRNLIAVSEAFRY